MKNSFSSKKFAILVLLIGIVLLAIAPLIIRWANAPGVVTSFYRMFIAAILLTVINLFRKPHGSKRKIPLAINIIPVIAGISSGIDHSLWSSAIENTLVAKANLLNYIAPIWVGLISVIFLHKRYSILFWFGLLVVIAGAWAISGVSLHQFSSIKVNGEGFAFFSSFFYAGFIILSEQSYNKMSSCSFVQISSFFAAATLLLIVVLSGYSLLGYPYLTYLFFGAAGVLSQMGGIYALFIPLGNCLHL